MVGRSGRRLSHAAVTAVVAIALGGCLFGRSPPAPRPVAEAKASICSIAHPPVLTRDEVAVTPRSLKYWTAGVKKSLKDNGC